MQTVAEPTAGQPDRQSPRPRWYRLTPDRFLIALLLVQGLLWLSERFRWFPFNEHKGWTVLIAVAVVCVAVVCVAVVLLLLWFGVSLVLRRRFQFSIRSLLVLVVAVAVVCSWFGVKMQQARRQREAVEKASFAVYDHQFDANGTCLPGPPEPPGPPWLRNLLGLNFLADLRIFISLEATDAELRDLKGILTNLEVLDLESTQVTDVGLVDLEGLTSLGFLDLSGTQVTDAGLVHLKGLTNLLKLWLGDTHVSHDGAEKLRQALPSCRISR